MAKLCILVYWLMPEADEPANEDIEMEIREELEKMMPPPLPYLKRVEKIIVLG